jgi:hypothetical protein
LKNARKIKKTKLRGRSPQENYTDQATATCRRSYCQPLRVEGVEWSAQRIPTAVNLFSRPECKIDGRKKEISEERTKTKKNGRKEKLEVK